MYIIVSVWTFILSNLWALDGWLVLHSTFNVNFECYWKSLCENYIYIDICYTAVRFYWQEMEKWLKLRILTAPSKHVFRPLIVSALVSKYLMLCLVLNSWISLRGTTERKSANTCKLMAIKCYNILHQSLTSIPKRSWLNKNNKKK